MPRSDRTFLRPRDGAVLGGVCAGLARLIGLDASVLRTLVGALAVVTAALAYFWLPLVFAVPLLYSIGWLAIPRE